MPRCSTLARRTATGWWPPPSSPLYSCGASWSTMMAASSHVRYISQWDRFVMRKRLWENHITVIDNRFLNCCSFPFSCILDVFSPFSSTLFTSMSASILTMRPAHFTLLLTNLPVELFCCITYFLRSFILLSSTLFVRVYSTKPEPTLQLLLLFCQRHGLHIQIKACLCNTSSEDFPFQPFQNVSVQHDSLYLSPSIRSLLYLASHFYLWMLILFNHSSKLHKAIHLVELLIIQTNVQVLSLMSNPHLFCLLPAHYRSVLLEHPLPFLQHFL